LKNTKILKKQRKVRVLGKSQIAVMFDFQIFEKRSQDHWHDSEVNLPVNAQITAC